MKNVILASASPRRKEMLSQIGVKYRVVVSDADENVDMSDPKEAVKMLSRIKATAVSDKVADEEVVIIGADTVVAVDDKVLGKPDDDKMAFDMIKMLQGRAHEVYTGVCILTRKGDDTICKNFACCTKVYVNEMTDEQIREYVASGESKDKAGAYAIQGLFSRHIKGIEGDYYNVVGLPVSMVYDELTGETNYHMGHS